ncbi:MAG: hypothetical protein ACI9SC_000688 [Gammaproteobacteria bacterium]|jgi:hypothetical protein
MKRNDIDWSILRGSLIIFFLCLVISASILVGSFYFKDKMHKEYLRNDAMFRSVSNRYFSVDEEEKLIKKYYPLFVDLYNRGVIGQERRLNWIEVLRNAGEEINIPGLSYDIKSQEIYQPGFSVNLGKYQLYRSIMSLDMKLLHEGDLFQLFQALDKHAQGAFNVSTCTLTSSGKAISEDTGAGNLNVKCELTWHTIKLADGRELEV